jgi:flagellar biosynthesis protein FlhF
LTSLRGLVEEQIAGLVWGDLARRNPVNAALLRQLSQLDLSPLLSREIVSELEGRRCTDAAHAWRHALVALARRVPTEEDTILGSGGIVALLGPTGAGKTTTIAKLAAHYCVRHGARRVALVTTDDYRIGAHDHLRTYARLLGVPLRVTSDAAGLAQAVADFSDRALVLVDSAGISQRDRRVSAQCTLIRSASDAVRCYLVLPATTRERSLEEIIHAYREVSPRGCIVTKLDECGDLGGVLSVLARNRLPVAYTSDGQRVPEDLDVACAYRLVSRAVALMRSAGPAAGVEAIARAAHA